MTRMKAETLIVLFLHLTDEIDWICPKVALMPTLEWVELAMTREIRENVP